MPTAGLKRKINDSGDKDDAAADHQAKRQRTLVAMAEGNVPLQKTWEMTELNNQKGLLSKFRVSLAFALLMTPILTLITLKGTCSTCHRQKVGAVGQLGGPNIEVKG